MKKANLHGGRHFEKHYIPNRWPPEQVCNLENIACIGVCYSRSMNNNVMRFGFVDYDLSEKQSKMKQQTRTDSD
jgi:hypothetical protein